MLRTSTDRAVDGQAENSQKPGAIDCRFALPRTNRPIATGLLGCRQVTQKNQPVQEAISRIDLLGPLNLVILGLSTPKCGVSREELSLENGLQVSTNHYFRGANREFLYPSLP
jgi:hypothetical protein